MPGPQHFILFLAAAVVVLPPPAIARPDDLPSSLAQPSQHDAPTSSSSTDVTKHAEDIRRLRTRAADAFAALDDETQQRELQRLAAASLANGDIDGWRNFISDHADDRWQDLDDTETILAMISWLPDTGEFLPARIDAAPYLVGSGALDRDAENRFWNGLEVRVARVGRTDLRVDLLLAMAESGRFARALSTAVATDMTARARLSMLCAFLDALHPKTDPEDIDALVRLIHERLEETRLPDASLDRLARAAWRHGATGLSLVALETMSDPLARLRASLDIQAAHNLLGVRKDMMLPDDLRVSPQPRPEALGDREPRE